MPTFEFSQNLTIKISSSEPEKHSQINTSNTIMPPFVPVAISAVESNQLSVLFYTRPDGDIACLTAQKQGEDPSFSAYKATNVLLDGNTVTASVPQVSAIAYDFKGNREVGSLRSIYGNSVVVGHSLIAV